MGTISKHLEHKHCLEGEVNLSSKVHQEYKYSKPRMHILYAKGRYVIRYLMKTDDTLKLGQLEESLFRKGLFTGAQVQRNIMVSAMTQG